MACMKEESIKYQLLETLRKEEVSGPFISDEEVRDYVNRGYDEETKVKRLYNEVRYARMSSISLKPTAAVFRLKRNYKNLPSEEYADNLISYLSSARSCRTITIEELNNVMHGIARKTNVGDEKEDSDQMEVASSSVSTNFQTTPQTQEIEHPAPTDNQNSFVIGEHVVAFWYETEVASRYC